MQLEKATARSSEAALAGWISSNDATLFTMVLVVVIAIFLHTKLTKGARNSLELTGEKEALSEKLDSTAGELAAATDLLDKTTKTLNLTQAERDQFRQQLAEKLDHISQLVAKLDVALKEKGQLATEHQSLEQAKETLTKEKILLMSQQSSLLEDRVALTTTNATLSERLDAISRQLADKLAALEHVEQERDRLKKQADQLDSIVNTLQQKLQSANLDLTETRERGVAALAESETKVHELETQLAEHERQAAEYLARLQRATALFEGLRAENRELQTTITKAEQQRQLELLEEGHNNRALLGLTGPMERVAILFDASGSMKQAGSGSEIDRWAESQNIATTWLQHLNVHHCVLIVFSKNVRTFPDDGSLADFRGEGGKSKREALLQQLKAVSPKGWTNTHDALRKAYQYNVDTILLLSDGAPSKSDTGTFDPAIAQQIYELCREHKNIPINSIGLGNYFDKDTSTFLQTVAKITGGTFRGN